MAFGYWLLWRERLGTFLYIIWWVWARIPGVELLGHRAGIYLALVNKANLFSKVTAPCSTPPAAQERSAVANNRQFSFYIRAILVWVGADIARRLCISLMTNEVEQLPVWVLAVWISSFVKCLFSIFVYLVKKELSVFLLIWRSPVCIVNMSAWSAFVCGLSLGGTFNEQIHFNIASMFSLINVLCGLLNTCLSPSHKYGEYRCLILKAFFKFF